MVRRKRPYVPKVKGCYECSQRRINCDQTRPGCLKCSSRGITCSGFGVKFRFRDGLPGGNKSSQSDSDSDKWQMQQVKYGAWKDEQFSVGLGDLASCTMRSSSSNVLPTSENAESEEFKSIQTPGDDASNFFDTIIEDREWRAYNLSMGEMTSPALFAACERQGYDITGPSTASTPDDESKSSPAASSPGGTSSWKDYLLEHFSEKIAPEMVVVDDEHNGWRSLVLPLAHSDEIVMNAVLAASAYHMTGSLGYDAVSDQLVDPSRLFVRAIEGLQRRRQLTDENVETQQTIILSIIVLMVSFMVNGCTDFPIIFQMLTSALDAIGGEAALEALGGEVAEFCLREIRKMRVCAAPLVSLDDGLLEIICRAEDSFDCLQYYTRLHPQYADAFKVIMSLRTQAFDIYVQRALSQRANSDPESKNSSEVASPAVEKFEPDIETFLQTLESFPEGAPGEHVLVWSCYIAGSASREPRHQEVLENFLERQYKRNGFVNILRALEMLRYIWSKDFDSENWPSMLPESRVFVM